ncbi:hypothetical protein vseg_019722 [Gypsophila vaccaria]
MDSKPKTQEQDGSSTAYPRPTSPWTTKIGWIGIGVMGQSMASRLISAGYSLTIFARNPTKATLLQSLGANLADSPARLAQSCDIVFTMLGHPQDVQHVVLHKHTGVLSGLRPNAVIVDHTSSHPGLAKKINALAREKKCWAVDAPVSGGDIGAKNGNLAIFAGGEKTVMEWLMPVLRIMGSKVTYMGDAGSGQSCKIGNQIMVGANLVGLSEGLVFAEKAGLDKGKWVEAIRGGAAGSMAMELFGKRMIERDFKPGGFVEYMVKDMGMGVNFIEGDKFVAKGALSRGLMAYRAKCSFFLSSL